MHEVFALSTFTALGGLTLGPLLYQEKKSLPALYSVEMDGIKKITLKVYVKKTSCINITILVGVT